MSDDQACANAYAEWNGVGAFSTFEAGYLAGKRAQSAARPEQGEQQGPDAEKDVVERARAALSAPVDQPAQPE